MAFIMYPDVNKSIVQLWLSQKLNTPIFSIVGSPIGGIPGKAYNIAINQSQNFFCKTSPAKKG